MAAKSGKSFIEPLLRDLVVALRGVDWHQLGTQLGVPQEELERIDEECRDVSRKLNKLLDYWLKNNGKPSWEKIVKALERIGRHGNIIIDLRSKYCSTPLKLSTSSSATVMNINGEEAHNGVQHSEDMEGQTDSCMNTATQTEVVTNEFSVKRAPDNDKIKDFQYLIKLDLEELRKKFITLKREIRESLSKKVTPQEIVAHVLSDYEDICENSDYNSTSLFSDTVEEKLNSATSVNQVFQILKKFWSFLKCEILYSIVEHCGDHTDRAKVKNYQEELKVFFNKRRVSEVPEELMSSSSVDEMRDKMLIKLDKENPPWCDITDLEFRICKILGIKPSALLIVGIRQGCVEITFSVPKHISQLIFSKPLTREQQDHFREASILRLSCGHIQLTFDEKKLSDEVLSATRLPHSATGLATNQLSRSILKELKSIEESTRQYERACAEMNRLQEDSKRTLQTTERLSSELNVLRYRIPPSHKISMVDTQISIGKAEIEELEEKIKEVQTVIEDHGRKSRSSKSAIAELLEEEQSQMVALEKKLLATTKAKEEEIRRSKTRLKLQKIKLTNEHQAACGKVEMHYMEKLREIEGRYQKALKSAELQHVTELLSKNHKIENLESKVKLLEAKLSAHQATVQSKIKKWFRQKKRDTTKSSNTIVKKDVLDDGSICDSQPSKFSVHDAVEQDQTSHVSTISSPFYYDQHSLCSLPAMHLRGLQDQQSLNQSNPYQSLVISPHKSDDSAKGYQSGPEDDDDRVVLPDLLDSREAVV